MSLHTATEIDTSLLPFLKYADLQKLAKAHRIKANQKACVLVERLKEVASRQQGVKIAGAGSIPQEVKGAGGKIRAAADREECKQAGGGGSECPICIDVISVPKVLECGHIFCEACIDQHATTNNPLCPLCMMPFGTPRGNQPSGGTMTYRTLNHSLPGYEGYRTIEIQYMIPSGIQNETHPNPGVPYDGTNRYCYLPYTDEGKRVYKLLQAAFENRLTFTVGTSLTTGRTNQVIWNDIHHKTSMTGGPQCFGYPDGDYLKRVQEELAAKGIR